MIVSAAGVLSEVVRRIEDKMDPAIALIPLLKGAKLSASRIRAHFAESWPEFPTPVPPDKKDGEIISFTVGESMVFIAMMRAPIPWSDLEGPCETSILWKDAAKVLKPHVGHLIVTVMEPGEDDVLELMGMLTRVCASVLATCEQAPGVYWGTATMLIPSEIFQKFTTDMLPHGAPLHIWVDVRVGASEKGGSSGFTTGMAALGHLEFETENATDSPQELWERLYQLAGYVIENGPVLQNGHTVGADASEKIRVVHAPSAFGHKGKVLRLEYETGKQKKSWWGRK